MQEEFRSFTLKPEDFRMEDLWFAMGYKGASPGEPFLSMAREMVFRLVPTAIIKYMYRIVPAERLSKTELIFEDRKFTPGGIICSYLDGMTEACIYVATAGREFDSELKKVYAEDDILASFIADSIGTVLAELAVERLENELSPRVGVSKSYSPGYCGWDLREQQEFFKLFPPEPCGIVLSESSLMSPEKSISGFFAMGTDLKKLPYHCEICSNTRCYKRRNA